MIHVNPESQVLKPFSLSTPGTTTVPIQGCLPHVHVPGVKLLIRAQLSACSPLPPMQGCYLLLLLLLEHTHIGRACGIKDHLLSSFLEGKREKPQSISYCAVHYAMLLTSHKPQSRGWKVLLQPSQQGLKKHLSPKTRRLQGDSMVLKVEREK